MCIPIMDTFYFELGPYTVWQRPRHDAMAWPIYLVFRGERIVGRSYSRPGLPDCCWLERQQDIDRPRYAEASAPLFKRSIHITRGGRPTNAERARRQAYLAEVNE